MRPDKIAPLAGMVGAVSRALDVAQQGAHPNSSPPPARPGSRPARPSAAACRAAQACSSRLRKPATGLSRKRSGCPSVLTCAAAIKSVCRVPHARARRPGKRHRGLRGRAAAGCRPIRAWSASVCAPCYRLIPQNALQVSRFSRHTSRQRNIWMIPVMQREFCKNLVCLRAHATDR